ncbi:MAG: hypothetical protein KC502_21610, partial [Myxococcales bacterium]|nr:hypothetical protein [Myxococcales bacterium]
DNNPCTSDSCDKSKGCQYKNVAGKCSDGDACTHKDTCSAGKCAGQKGACNDGNVCTTDACDSKTGCKPKTVKPGPCDDGSKCTTGDKCDPKGACVGLGKNCSDDNSCTLDGCDAKTAKCTHTDSGDGVPCDDGNLCTLSDKCVGEVAGKCIGKATKCDDKESCTNDSCQLGKCVFAKKSDNAFCNDGQTCTTTDRCIGGKCQGKPRTNGSYCTDGNTCTAAESCVDGKCAAGGALKDGSVCSDGSTCTIGDACKSGKCTGQPNAPLCDDENPCTIDVCAPHDDKAGPGGCTHKPLKDGAACDDGNLCTGQDACDKGACKPGKDHCSGAGVALDEPFDCGKPTAFVMDPVVPANQTGWHIDGTPNPPGYASKGCSLNYNDGKSYPGKTKGTATSGLIKVPSGSPTLTFNSYHGVESSSSYDKRYVEISVDNFKTKVSTQLSNSVGKKVWTKNTVKLDAFAGKNIKIRFVFDSVDNISNGTTGWFIDDLLIGLKTLPTVCKIDAHCNDGSPCTVGSCDPKSGKCLQNPGGDGAACNPAYKACTEGGLCKAGVCKALAKDCDDNKPCTTDSCNPKSGECEHVNVKGGTPCDDGNACKPKTFCNPYGSCNGPTINCNDSDGCTYDKCDNNTGCNHVPQPAGTTCDDGNKCTVDQTCKAGKCQTGPLKNCDDNDKCTADSCDKLKGCTYTVIKGCGAPQSLPYSADFQCGSAGSKAWVLTPSQSLGSPGWWGIDGTPSQPKPRSPSCTLNFNDGSDFKCNGTKSSHGTAKSPVINLAGAVKPQIQFYLSGTWRSSSAETLQLQVKEYGQVSWQTAGTYNHSGTSWQLISRNLTAWSGKFIQIRFNFTVSSCYSTTGQGPFIDDLTIKATGCNSDKDCKQDSNPCTNEFCTFTKKCSTQKLSFKSCDDGSTCTTDDACSDGKCLGVQKKCSDGNACTADSCDQLAGCKNVQMPSGAKCEDGNLCTTGDTCQLKLCKAGMPTVCNDKNACTVDTCDPKAGCQHKAALDGTKCGDGECKAGKCGGVGTSSVMYSHTATQLFHLDVAKLQIKPIGKFTFDKFAGNVGDVALNGKGQLLAVTDAHLFLCDASNAKCVWRLKMPTFLNGLTFVPAGMFHPQNETLIGVSPDGGWYRIAWDDLLPSVVKVGSYGSPYKSSGDAVSVPGMGTFATVTGGFVGSNDMLASVNPKTGKVIKIIGQLGAKQLWGLAWGGEALWAFGSSGDVYAVDPKTAKIGGQSKPVPGAQWWGAGSSGL